MRETILLKAREMFTTFGIRNVTMEELANHLGISKKTIYIWFDHKDDLVKEVFSFPLESAQQACIQIEHSSENAVHEVFLVYQALQPLFGTLSNRMLHDLKKYYDTTYQELKRFVRHFLRHLIRDNLSRGCREKLYRENIEVEFLSDFKMATLFVVYTQDLISDMEYHPAVIQESLFNVFFHGIISPLGKYLFDQYSHQMYGVNDSFN